jgi:hypothetical protein
VTESVAEAEAESVAVAVAESVSETDSDAGPDTDTDPVTDTTLDPASRQAPCSASSTGGAALLRPPGRSSVGAVAVGLLIEEHRVEIQEAWVEAVRSGLGGEPALEFAVGPILRELSLALRGDGHRPGGPRPDPHARCAVLVRSAATPVRCAREFKLLHRAVWDTLRGAGRVVAADERRALDEWLDDALAAALERLDRIRARIELVERGPEIVGPAAPPQHPRPASQKPPPLPWARSNGAASPSGLE